MTLKEIENIPLAPPYCVTGFGTTLVIAPHADDESLGCGGLISLLTKYGQTVYILLLSDGTLSHPNSQKYPPERLRDLREKELISAAKILGVAEEHISFCRYGDRNVPCPPGKEFDLALEEISRKLAGLTFQSIFVPWRRDPHPDHRAAYQLINAINYANTQLYEYPVWLTNLGETGDEPTMEEVIPFRLDISSVIHQKQEAIAAHRSQITNLIDDDPNGFRLYPDLLEPFNLPFETFFISK